MPTPIQTIRAALPALPVQKFWTWISVFFVGLGVQWVYNAISALVYKRYPWQSGFMDYLHMWLLVAAILFSIRKVNRVLDQRFPWEKELFLRLALQILSNLGIALLFTLVVRNLIRIVWNIFPLISSFIRLQDEVILALVVSAFILLVVLVDLGFFLMGQWKASATEAERFKQENLEFRFDRLKNQVNPHFLFNSLNTLASLVYQDPDTASGFIRQMAKVYRYVLENRDKEVITLAEEFNFLEAYLYLVKIRFQEGIRFELNVPNEARQAGIPPMTLQLLIENALKHNVVSASRPLLVTVRTAGNYLSVSNNLQPKLSPEPSTKTGLENIRSRYAFLTSLPVEILQSEQDFTVRVPLLSLATTESKSRS